MVTPFSVSDDTPIDCIERDSLTVPAILHWKAALAGRVTEIEVNGAAQSVGIGGARSGRRPGNQLSLRTRPLGVPHARGAKWPERIEKSPPENPIQCPARTALAVQ